MQRLELGEIDLESSIEINKRRSKRMFELVSNQNKIKDSESPFSRKNMANAQDRRVKVSKSEIQDIQNIGSGTRCAACGLLHFCWTPRCAVCGEQMYYNLGGHHQ